MLLACIEGLAF